jgi:hypothetical protein
MSKYLKRLLKVFLILTLFSINLLYSQELSKAAKPLACFQAGDLWYFIDSQGKEMFKPIPCTDIGGYSEGLLRVMLADKEKKWVFLDEKGNIALKPDCDLLSNFQEEMAMIINYKDSAKKELVYGFINKAGELVIPMIYDDAINFSNGLAYIMNKERRGYIDKEGQMIIPLKDFIGYAFSDDLALVNNQNYKLGYIDKYGRIVIDLIFDEAGSFSEGLAFANNQDKMGYIDKKGKFIIDADFDFANDFKNNRAFVGKLTKMQVTNWGIIDKSGKKITNFIYDGFRNFSEGLATIQKSNLWGFIDTDGRYIVTPKFASAESFVDGLAFCFDKNNNRMGYINTEGQFIVTLPVIPTKIFDLRENKYYPIIK